MSEISIIGSLKRTSILILENLFTTFFKDVEINRIESGNVLVCDEEPFLFSIEPEEYQDVNETQLYDFYFTGRFFGDLVSCTELLDDLVKLLSMNDVTYNLDFQEEDLNGDPIGLEYNLQTDNINLA